MIILEIKVMGLKVINHLINEAKKLKIKRLSIETGAGDFFLTS
jgi:putative acetyltransferase